MFNVQRSTTSCGVPVLDQWAALRSAEQRNAAQHEVLAGTGNPWRARVGLIVAVAAAGLNLSKPSGVWALLRIGQAATDGQ